MEYPSRYVLFYHIDNKNAIKLSLKNTKKLIYYVLYYIFSAMNVVNTEILSTINDDISAVRGFL